MVECCTAVMRTRFECLAIRGMGTPREEDGKVDEEFNQRARGRAWQALKVGGVFSDVGQRRACERKNFTATSAQHAVAK